MPTSTARNAGCAGPPWPPRPPRSRQWPEAPEGPPDCSPGSERSGDPGSEREDLQAPAGRQKIRQGMGLLSPQLPPSVRRRHASSSSNARLLFSAAAAVSSAWRRAFSISFVRSRGTPSRHWRTSWGRLAPAAMAGEGGSLWRKCSLGWMSHLRGRLGPTWKELRGSSGRW